MGTFSFFFLESGLINDDANTTFSFKPNKTYRLRILNIGGIATFNVYIDGHEMEVIEQDGVRKRNE
jgi:iron transport multicopper oxidase